MFVVKACLEKCKHLSLNKRLSSFKDSYKDLILAWSSISSFKNSFVDVYNCNKGKVNFIGSSYKGVKGYIANLCKICKEVID